MGTHPIFESDFDCLTVMIGIRRIRCLSASHVWQSKYRWGPSDIVPPVIPKDISKEVIKQNIPPVSEDHRMSIPDIRLHIRKYLTRGAATDHGATMTANFGILVLKDFEMKELGAQAYFRIPEPWHPKTARKGNSTRGHGKPGIHRWITPIKPRTILLEIDVECTFDHIYPILVAAIKSVEGRSFQSGESKTKGRMIQHGTLMPIQRSTLIKMYEEERKIDMANENFFTHREIYAKNMGGIRNNHDRWRRIPGVTQTQFEATHRIGSKIHRIYKGLYR